MDYIRTDENGQLVFEQSTASRSHLVYLGSIMQRPSLGKQHPEEPFTAFREILTCRKVNAGVNAERGFGSFNIVDSSL